jgi:monosaccharide-transporting ATPase
MSETLLEVRGLEKQFPGVKALDGVDFTLRPGEIHALMGENGAGKSTLIKTLTGVYQRDGGEIRLDGRAINASSPKAAEALGISTVYQEVNLVPHLSVAENICLGREPLRFGMIRWGEVRRRAEAALARLEMTLDVTREVASYSVAVQQMVAIARALDVDARLLILDEPTASLDEGEVEELFSVLRKLREQGLGIVFVTHFLDQVYAVTDRITIFRDGRLVGEYETANLPRAELVSRMIGKELAAISPASHEPHPEKDEERKAPFMTAKQLGRAGSMAPFDLNIAPGEVVGLAGLLGSGRTEVARLLFGVDKADTGTIEVNGKSLELSSPRQAIDSGFAFTPENRKVEGIIPHLSVRENIILALQSRQGMWNKFSYSEQVGIADHFIRALNIKTPSPEQAVRNLSGGNQQKVLLARWLANKPLFLILDEPTRGIDVGAKADIEGLISSLRAEGMAILFICSELEEVVRTCERVAVLRDRTKVGELSGPQVQESTIMHTIAGGASTAGGAAHA